jgi:hypothetical protein
MVSEEAPVPGFLTITVLTASGERRFAATSFSEDDDHYLTVLNGSHPVARFAPGAWTGVHEDTLADLGIKPPAA